MLSITTKGGKYEILGIFHGKNQKVLSNTSLEIYEEHGEIMDFLQFKNHFGQKMVLSVKF